MYHRIHRLARTRPAREWGRRQFLQDVFVRVINLVCLLHTGPAETHGRTETAFGHTVQESGGLRHGAHPDC